MALETEGSWQEHRRPWLELRSLRGGLGARAVLGCPQVKSPPDPCKGLWSTLTLQLLHGWGPAAPGPRSECPCPGCFSFPKQWCLVNLPKPQQNWKQRSPQSWHLPWICSRPPPFHLSPFLLKAAECCLIRIKGFGATIRFLCHLSTEHSVHFPHYDRFSTLKFTIKYFQKLFF